MAADKFLEQMLQQLSVVLQMAEDASRKPLKGPVPADAATKVLQLEMMLAQLKQSHEAILRDMGVPEEQIQGDIIPTTEPKTEQEKAVLKQANELAKAAKQGYDDLTFSIKQVKAKSDAPKTRKKKFDRLGGRKKWKPM